MNQITENNLPIKIQTGLCSLKKFESADSESFLRLVESERQRIAPHFGVLASSVSSLEESISYIDSLQAQWAARESYFYGMWDKSQTELIGQMQVKNIEWKTPKAELAFFISQKHEGAGTMSSAITEICKQCFDKLGFVKVFLRVDPLNTRSVTLAKKLGFIQEGLFKKDHRNGVGELIDVSYFGLFSGRLD